MDTSTEAKIICSTDKFLGWTNIGTCEEGRVIGNKIGEANGCLFEPLVPYLSENSIKFLIDYYNKNNKMPNEVEITTDCNVQKINLDKSITKIITNLQGTVDVSEISSLQWYKDMNHGFNKQAKSEEKLYTKKEVETLTYNAMKERSYTPYIVWKEWSKDNL